MKYLKNKPYLVDISHILENKTVCLTLDLEQDFGSLLDEASFEGFGNIPDLVNLLEKYNIPLTCFVQGSLLETHGHIINQFSKIDVEFEAHTYNHPRPKLVNHELELKKTTKSYNQYFGKAPLAYRSCAGITNQELFRLIAKYGYKIDSSIIPSLRPGWYNSINKPVLPYFIPNTEVVEFPASVVSNIIRIPICLSYIKLLGKSYYSFLKYFPLPKLIMFGFHLHDLSQLISAKNILSNRNLSIQNTIFHRIYFQDRINGIKCLESMISLFLYRGYTFSKLANVYQVIYGNK